MKLLLLLAAVLCALTLPAMAATAKKTKGHLRHVVSFKFKETAS